MAQKKTLKSLESLAPVAVISFWCTDGHLGTKRCLHGVL